MERFAHGGNVHEIARRVQRPPEEIVDFSASINPLGLPAPVREALVEGIADVVHYPDPYARDLRGALASWLEVDETSVLVGNGSTDLLYLLLQQLRPRQVLIPVPSFLEYERAALAANSRPTFIATQKSQDYRITLRDLDPHLYETDLCLLGHPNTPTGLLVDRGTLEALLERGVPVVVDEAFIDFVHHRPSMRSALREFPQLCILGSLTKFYALAGLRVGYLIAHPAFVAALAAMQPPWSVSLLAQRAALAALQDEDYRARTATLIAQERPYLQSELSRLELVALPSACNFLLVEVPEPSEILWERLVKQGVLVRDCRNFRGLDGNYIRVAVRTRAENNRLLDALRTSL